MLNDLPGDAVQAVADEIAADGGQAVVAAGDVADWATGEKLLATALERYGRLDILVNNAGVLRDRMVFTMSAGGVGSGHPGAPARATSSPPGWPPRTGGSSGKRPAHPVYARIVNTSSEAFLLGSLGQPNYAAAKAGIAALTVTTARAAPGTAYAPTPSAPAPAPR